MADAQRAIPLPNAAGRPPAPAPAPAQVGAGAPPAMDPMAQASLAAQAMPPPPPGGMFRSSDRPDEPLTAGLPLGQGRGPEAVTIPTIGPNDEVLFQLHNAYQRNPSPALARLIDVVRARATADFRTRQAGRQMQRRLQ